MERDQGWRTDDPRRSDEEPSNACAAPARCCDRTARGAEAGRRRFHLRPGGKTPFRGRSWTKLRLDARITITTGKPLAPWVLHDLRRTMRSGLSKIGIPPHVAERAINHVKGGVEAIYDRHHYQREIGNALARWADHVLAIVEGRESNVVALQSA